MEGGRDVKGVSFHLGQQVNEDDKHRGKTRKDWPHGGVRSSEEGDHRTWSLKRGAQVSRHLLEDVGETVREEGRKPLT